MDATASREPTWDRASHLQAEMFKETEALGGLDVQLIYYRGFGECRASPWVSESAKLLRFMTGVFCLAGDRMSVVKGKIVSVRVTLGGRRIIKQKKIEITI